MKWEKLKRLEDFEAVGDSDVTPLYAMYPSVPFSELRTFDLMRLLFSFRRSSRRSEHKPGTKEYIDQLIKEKRHWYADNQQTGKAFNILTNNFDFSDAIKQWEWSKKYEAALKKELATRENLTQHEKRSAHKRSR